MTRTWNSNTKLIFHFIRFRILHKMSSLFPDINNFPGSRCKPSIGTARNYTTESGNDLGSTPAIVFQVNIAAGVKKRMR
jgi:hypothetical protein